MREVAAAIGEVGGGVFYARQLAEVIGVPDNAVAPVIRRLESAGLVAKLPRVEAELRQYLRREESQLWELTIELGSEGRRRGS